MKKRTTTRRGRRLVPGLFSMMAVMVTCLGVGNGPGRAQETCTDCAPLQTEPFIFEGTRVGEHIGWIVAGGGDVNGDDLSDVLVAAPPTVGYGRIHLFLGTEDGLSVPDWSLTGSDIVPLKVYIGAALAFAGDVNGDGYDDVIAGGPDSFEESPLFGQGAAFLFLGSPTGPGSVPDWTVYGSDFDERLGEAVAGAGDVNGDGFDDVVIGAPQFTDTMNYQGRALLFPGSAQGLATEPIWFRDGDQVGARYGSSVAPAGDVNADGYDDFLVGAWSSPGRAELFLGSPSGPSAVPDWAVEGQVSFWDFAAVVRGAGDVNGDGFDDVLVTEPGYNGTVGRALLYLGSAAGPPRFADWIALGSGRRDLLGTGAALDGDIDRDGRDDVLLGLARSEEVAPFGGAARLYEGRVPTPTSMPVWEAFGDENAGFGTSVDFAGDINCDGAEDVVVGAPFHSSSRGAVFFYFGRPPDPFVLLENLREQIRSLDLPQGLETSLLSKVKPEAAPAGAAPSWGALELQIDALTPLWLSADDVSALRRAITLIVRPCALE